MPKENKDLGKIRGLCLMGLNMTKQITSDRH